MNSLVHCSKLLAVLFLKMLTNCFVTHELPCLSDNCLIYLVISTQQQQDPISTHVSNVFV